MKICQAVLDAHAQFGGDLETMQKAYEWNDLKLDVETLRSALSAQVQDVAAGLENDPLQLRHYCQQLLDVIENYDITHDACEEEIAMINDIRAATDPAAPAKQEGCTNE